MKVLFVAPALEGTGEAITAVHLTERLLLDGHSVAFLASPLASDLARTCPGVPVFEMGDDLSTNAELWATAMAAGDDRPDVIVFADYPLLFMPEGTSPLAAAPGWVESLDETEAALATLDHLGLAQRPGRLYMGAPHLAVGWIPRPQLPEAMRVLLPCPVQEPHPVPGRIGQPFGFLKEAEAPSALAVAQARARFLAHEEDFLILHSVPRWAWRQARMAGLPHYEFLPEILAGYLRELPRPVTVVSINDCDLLAAAPATAGEAARSRVRFVNVPSVPVGEYEVLLAAADLVLTESAVSSATGKAVCALRPCALLKNSFRLVELLDRVEGRLRQIVLEMEARRPGAVFPYEALPAMTRRDIDALGVHRDNSLPAAVESVEIFGGPETAASFRGLLADPAHRAQVAARNRVYADRVRRLDHGATLLARLPEEQLAYRR